MSPRPDDTLRESEIARILRLKEAPGIAHGEAGCRPLATRRIGSLFSDGRTRIVPSWGNTVRRGSHELYS